MARTGDRGGSDGSGAAITAHCPTLFARGCDIGYEIAVPRGFAVDLRASSGDLDIRGVTARNLRTEVSSGRTTLVDVAGPVEMRSSSGSITATRLSSADLTADVSSGSTSLDFAAAPTPWASPTRSRHFARPLRWDVGSGRQSTP
jgi:hypothetical protein